MVSVVVWLAKQQNTIPLALPVVTAWIMYLPPPGRVYGTNSVEISVPQLFTHIVQSAAAETRSTAKVREGDRRARRNALSRLFNSRIRQQVLR